MQNCYHISDSLREALHREWDREYSLRRKKWGEAAEMLETLNEEGRIAVGCGEHIVCRHRNGGQLAKLDETGTVPSDTEMSPAFVLAAAAGLNLADLNGYHISAMSEELHENYGMFTGHKRRKAGNIAASMECLPQKHRNPEALACVWRRAAAKMKHGIRCIDSENAMPRRYLKRPARKLVREIAKAQRLENRKPRNEHSENLRTLTLFGGTFVAAIFAPMTFSQKMAEEASWGEALRMAALAVPVSYFAVLVALVGTYLFFAGLMTCCERSMSRKQKRKQKFLSETVWQP